MKKLFISVAILMFATVLFVHEEENTSDDNLAKEEVVRSSTESQSDS